MAVERVALGLGLGGGDRLLAPHVNGAVCNGTAAAAEAAAIVDGIGEIGSA